MPVRLVTGPVLLSDGYRMPKAATLGCQHASVISDGLLGQDNDWCLSLVACDDFAAVDADTSIHAILPQEPDMESDALVELLQQTPNERGWTSNQMLWFQGIIEERGGDGSGLDQDLPINVLLERLTLLLGATAADLLQLRAG